MTGAWRIRTTARALPMLLLPMLACLGGCAGPRPPVAAASAGAGTGTIVSARPAPLVANGAGGGVLDALGVSSEAGATGEPAIEYIVREAGGGIVSVVQPGSGDLHPGTKVRILHTGTVRLTPVAPE
ncbi:MAG TPA: hypothetical protein VF286_08910 [Acidiphilium sp.]